MRLTEELQTRFAETDVEQLQAQGALVASNESGRLTCQFADCEKIACEVSQLRLESQHLSNLDTAQAKELAGQLVERLTYLLEPLSIVEADELVQTVQVRSTNPCQSDGTRAYYELLVEPGVVSFGRYRKSANSPREATPCSLTREVILRISHDLESVVAKVA